MPIFEADPHFIERLRRETTSRADRSCETMPEPTSTPIPIRLCEHPSLHRRALVLRAAPDRRQQPGRRRDAAKSPHRGLPRPDGRPAGLRLFRRNAGGDPRGAGDHSPRRPHQGLCRLCRARGRFGDPHARHALPVGVARLSRADRLRVCRALRRHRGLDQRQGDQLESRSALRPLPDRQFRRFRQRTIGLEAARAGRLFLLRRRRRAAGARDRADGDDQRRSARPAAKRAPPPHLARRARRRFRAVRYSPRAPPTAPCSRSARYSRSKSA